MHPLARLAQLKLESLAGLILNISSPDRGYGWPRSRHSSKCVVHSELPHIEELQYIRYRPCGRDTFFHRLNMPVRWLDNAEEGFFTSFDLRQGARMLKVVFPEDPCYDHDSCHFSDAHLLVTCDFVSLCGIHSGTREAQVNLCRQAIQHHESTLSDMDIVDQAVHNVQLRDCLI